MNTELIVERLFEALITGDRDATRAVVDQATRQGLDARTLLTEVLWPVYEQVEKLHRADQMTTLAHHFATRLIRVLCDQANQRLQRRSPIGRTVLAVCGPTDADELAGQIATDLLEEAGFTTRYAGGGIASDEVLAEVQESQPDVLLLFASAPSDLPGIRGLIDTLNEIGASRQTQIVVGGGVFNRAEGLAEEIGADLWATRPTDLVQAMIEQPARRAAAEQHTVGRKRRPAPRAARAA